MPQRYLRSAFAVAVSLFLAGATPPRKPVVPSFGESIEVAVVNVDVIVTDRDGNRVRGLTRGDFEVLENGKPQALSHFAEYRGASGAVGVDAAAAESTDEPPAQPRTIVVFLEKFKLQSFRVEPFIASMKQLVRESVRPGDSVTIVLYDRKPFVRLEATGDVAAAEAVLDGLSRELVGGRFEETANAAHEAQEVRDFEADATAFAAQKGLSRVPTAPKDIVANAARLHALEARVHMVRRVAAINTILHGMAGVEGKKMLILATRRLGEYVGAEFYYAAGHPEQMLPPGERDVLDNRALVRTIIDNANAAGVTVYPVYASADEEPADPSVPDTSRFTMMNEMAMLQQVAKETGGLTTYGTANIVKLLPSVADDATDYYSLAYRGTAAAGDSTRKIVVRTKDRGLRVRSRQEFVYKTDESRMRERLIAAVHGLWKESPFTLAAELGEPTPSGRRTKRHLEVRIPIGSLTLVPQGEKHSGAFSVYVVSTARSGETGEVTSQTQTFEVPVADVERAMKSHFTYALDVELGRDAEKLAVGVLDEVSKEYGLLTLPVAD